MTPEQWERLKTIFHAALDQPPAARRAWLQQACAGDTSLLREAEALLRTHETAGDFLEAPAQVDPADLETLPPGARLGQYEVLEEIGRGGMGVVYLAEDVRLGRRVALKSLPASVGASAELRERLRREARAAATISHPSVATVYALEEQDEQLFIVTEYVRGETLRSEIDRGPIDLARACSIAADVAHALAAAHDAGVIHRDLKPENVLVTPDGRVKVVDFGIAHVEGSQATRLTRAGALLGTPAYMAPEQLLDLPTDARADIYAFGVVLHEMMSGHHPMSNVVVPPPPASPGEGGAHALRFQLEAIARRCLQRDPNNRFRSARALIDALESAPELGVDSVDADRAADADAMRTRGAGTREAPTGARWWWEFHQVVAALAYWVVVIPGWQARERIGGSIGRAFFIALLAAVIVSATLRLNLWFTSRFYPGELAWQRRRIGIWVRLADWAFTAVLVSGTLLIRDERSTLPPILISVAVAAAVAFLVIEPTTARAAFKETPADH